MAKSAEILQLGDHVFNVETKQLQGVGGEIVPLRSQSAEVLAYLAKHAGRTVSKDEIIEAVWAGTFVTDDSLVQCIRDIRLAIGDSAHAIVQTFPKKGYRLNVAAAAGGATEGGAGRLRLGALAVLAVAVAAGAAMWLTVFRPDPVVAVGDKPRIAVLAFDDFSTGEDRGYLSDAIAEGIITELARSSLIEVVARNSSFQFRGADADVREIGEKLRAHYVLEGSQQKNGDKLKVTVQLIAAKEGTHLAALTYDQEIGDLFTVQDEIVRTVANRIGLRIQRPVPGRDPERVSALHLYLEGLAAIRDSFNEETVAANIARNERVVGIDPDSPYGYIGLAHSYRAVATFGWLGLDSQEAIDKALGFARTALEIAPDDSEVHYALARVYSEMGARDEAMAAYDRAIELNPSASNYLVGSTTPLLYEGQTEEAIARLHRAMGIDPFHEDWFHWQMGWALWEIEDCEGALAAMLKMNKIRRGAHRMLAGIYACLGQVEKAREAYEVFYSEAREPTIAEQRDEWKDIWTAPGSLDRWLDHMRIAGMKD